jgi:LysM repeat protein
MEKTMKKKTLYTVLIAILVLSFVLAVSCGGTPAPTPAPTREPTVAEPETTAAPPPPAPTTTPTPAEPTRPTPVAQGPIILEGAQAYTVAPGNTLSGISRRFYGDTDYFPLIMLGSSDVSDPDVIELDTKLTIPDLKRNIADPGAKAKMKSYYNEIADIYEKRNRPHYAAQLRKLADSL